MKNEDWTHRLHERLKDYEASPPEGLWDDLAKRLPAAPEPKPRARFVPLMRWTGAAAAAVALLLVGGAYLASDDESGAPVAGRQRTAQGFSSAPSSQPLLAQAEPDSRSTEPRPRPTVLEEYVEMVSSVLTQTDIETEVQSVGQESEQTSKPNSPNSGEKPVRSSGTSTSYGNGRTHTSYTAMASTPRSSRFTLGLNASGGLGSDQAYAGSMTMSSGLLASSPMADANIEESPEMATYTEKKHHMRPFSFGLSVGYGLTDRLSVHTGVVYTEAVSDFSYSVGMRQATDRQSLKYIGVPLSVSYKLLNGKRFSVYAKAGGQADFNVSATLEADGEKNSVGHDRTQFSVDAAVGAEYDVLPHVGVYAEPGVKYYFNNGSSVENYFKEHPTAFNLELGLRVKF